MGYKGLGSDKEQKQIDNAEKNLLWIKNRYKLPPGRFELVLSDAKDLAANLPKLSYEAVATEGPLGPAYLEPPTADEIRKNFKNLQAVYLTAFASFKKVLSPANRRVVIALPAYRAGKNYVFYEIVDKILKLGYDIVDPLPAVLLERFEFLQVTARRSIIYDRKDQFVSREIFIFENK